MSKKPRLRTLREFAEAEIVPGEGPYANLPFRVEREPWTGHFFDAVDSGRYRRYASVGPVQSGRTLCTVVIPVLWHLCEWRETVVMGVPVMDIAHDKWKKEIEPVMRSSPRLSRLLPDTGRGSRGGTFESITLKNGATLRFMAATGGDEERSGYTARIAAVTEVDKMDEASESSRETDPISQIEVRTQSHDQNAIIYLECTASIPKGRIWQEVTGWAENPELDELHSRIACQCPGCGLWQTPERESLSGYQEALDELAAEIESVYFCRGCGLVWTDEERREMNQASRLIHRGQSIAEDGTIVGDPPRTNTLGFRWNAFNVLMWRPGTVGRLEWQRARKDDDDLATEALERKLRQFFWAMPAEPDTWAHVDLDARKLCARGTGDDDESEAAKHLKRGIVPADSLVLSMGVDIGKFNMHWVLVAWRPNGVAHVVEYGVYEVPGQTMAVERAILTALLSFCEERIKTGWPDLRQKVHWPACVVIDAGYKPDAVFEFCRRMRKEDPSHPKRFLPAWGRGTSQQKSVAAPQQPMAGKTVFRGDFYEVKKHADRGVAHAVWPNSDHWKSTVHERLATPAGAPGSLVFYLPSQPNEHLGIAKQLTAEKVIQEFVPGKGIVDKWVNESRSANHYFDASYIGLIAGHLCGQGLREPAASSSAGGGQAVAPRQPFTLPDGRPYFVGDRAA